MRTWTLCSLCTLLTCLGCGTMSYNRTARPVFTNPLPVPNSPLMQPPLMKPPLMKPAPTPLPSTISPSPVTPVPLTQPSGPTLNAPTSKKSPGQVGAARVSRYRANNLDKASNPPPEKGYVELGPPTEKNARGD